MRIAVSTPHSWVKTLLLALLCAIGSFVHGVEAQVSVRTEISPTSGSVDDLFLFTVVVEGSQAASPPLLSGGDDFDLRLLGPRSTISIINGTMHSRVSYVYHLTPKHEGNLSTPRAEVRIDGKAFSAPSVEVPVARGTAHDHKDSSAPAGNAIFLKQTATPLHVYQGQQIRQAITVYTRVDLSDLNMQPTRKRPPGFLPRSPATLLMMDFGKRRSRATIARSVKSIISSTPLWRW